MLHTSVYVCVYTTAILSFSSLPRTVAYRRVCLLIIGWLTVCVWCEWCALVQDWCAGYCLRRNRLASVAWPLLSDAEVTMVHWHRQAGALRLALQGGRAFHYLCNRYCSNLQGGWRVRSCKFLTILSAYWGNESLPSPNILSQELCSLRAACKWPQVINIPPYNITTQDSYQKAICLVTAQILLDVSSKH